MRKMINKLGEGELKAQAKGGYWGWSPLGSCDSSKARVQEFSYIISLWLGIYYLRTTTKKKNAKNSGEKWKTVRNCESVRIHYLWFVWISTDFSHRMKNSFNTLSKNCSAERLVTKCERTVSQTRWIRRITSYTIFVFHIFALLVYSWYQAMYNTTIFSLVLAIPGSKIFPRNSQ